MQWGPIEPWLSRYLEAWSTDDPGTITGLFSEHARYYTAPYRQPLEGSDDIATWWMARAESALNWTFEYQTVAREGNLFVVRGRTTYAGGPGGREVFHNLWLVTLDDEERATEFVEYWMLEEQSAETPSGPLGQARR